MKVNIDINEIKKLLPHRYPFLMVDKIVDIEGTKITAIKNVTANEPFFQGHFPGMPVMPGVLIVEALAQTGGVRILQEPQYKGKAAYFASMNNIKFRKPVVPGDTLILEAEIIKWKAKIAVVHGLAKVGEDVVAEADFLISMIDTQEWGKP